MTTICIFVNYNFQLHGNRIYLMWNRQTGYYSNSLN